MRQLSFAVSVSLNLSVQLLGIVAIDPIRASCLELTSNFYKRFCAGYQLNAINFFIFFLNLFMTSLSASAVVYAVSASINMFAVANLISVMIFAFMLVSVFLIETESAFEILRNEMYPFN